MHQLLRYCVVAVLVLFMTSAGVISNDPKDAGTKALSSLSRSEVKKLTRGQMEGYMGRPMTRMEKVAFALNKKKFANYVRIGDEGKVNTLAVVALATSWIPPVGLVFGILALGQLRKRRHETGRGLAWAAIVINGLFLLVLIGLAAFPG